MEMPQKHRLFQTEKDDKLWSTLMGRLTTGQKDTFLDFFNHAKSCKQCMPTKPASGKSISQIFSEPEENKRTTLNWLDRCCETGRDLFNNLANREQK